MKAQAYRLELAAVGDLEESVDHLAAESPNLAVRFLEACQHTFERLTEFPELGRAYDSRDERLAGIRFFPVNQFKRWLVFYRLHSECILIERVIHSSRDLQAVLYRDRPF